MRANGEGIGRIGGGAEKRGAGKNPMVSSSKGEKTHSSAPTNDSCKAVSELTKVSQKTNARSSDEGSEPRSDISTIKRRKITNERCCKCTTSSKCISKGRIGYPGCACRLSGRKCSNCKCHRQCQNMPRHSQLLTVARIRTAAAKAVSTTVEKLFPTAAPENAAHKGPRGSLKNPPATSPATTNDASVEHDDLVFCLPVETPNTAVTRDARLGDEAAAAVGGGETESDSAPVDPTYDDSDDGGGKPRAIDRSHADDDSIAPVDVYGPAAEQAAPVPEGPVDDDASNLILPPVPPAILIPPSIDGVVDPDADLPGYQTTAADERLEEVYGDHPHNNDGTHLRGGIDRDALWQRRWKRVCSLSTSRYSLPKGPTGKRFLQVFTTELGGLRQ